MVRIDPLNKCFMAIFWIVILATIGFFIGSIFMKSSNEEDSDSVVEIKFANSNRVVKLRSKVSDDDEDGDGERYMLELYNGT